MYLSCDAKSRTDCLDMSAWVRRLTNADGKNQVLIQTIEQQLLHVCKMEF